MLTTKTDLADKTIEDLEDLDAVGTGPLILCRLCESAITSRTEEMMIEGSKGSCFTNPQGIRFALTYYRNALGCSIGGLATKEYTWFRGYQWQMALCSQCQSHLGWYFESSEHDYFFGLIGDRLMEQLSDTD